MSDGGGGEANFLYTDRREDTSMGKVDWTPIEYGAGTKLMSMAGMTIQVEFDDGENELLLVDNLRVSDNVIRAAVTNLSDTDGTYRLTGETGGKELVLWRHTGEGSVDVGSDVGWEEFAVVADIPGFSTDRPELPDDESDEEEEVAAAENGNEAGDAVDDAGEGGEDAAADEDHAGDQ